jgi:hypothetical protein
LMMRGSRNVSIVPRARSRSRSCPASPARSTTTPSGCRKSAPCWTTSQLSCGGSSVSRCNTEKSQCVLPLDLRHKSFSKFQAGQLDKLTGCFSMPECNRYSWCSRANSQARTDRSRSSSRSFSVASVAAALVARPASRRSPRAGDDLRRKTIRSAAWPRDRRSQQ